jgi:hypothetical protein
MDHELDPKAIGEVSDLIYSISNLCAVFACVRDCSPNSLKLLPTIMEEIYCKSAALIEFCVVPKTGIE